MSVNIVDAPDYPHTRYLLVSDEALCVTTIHGLIEHRDDEEFTSFVVVARDGSSEPILLEQEDDGTWVVSQSSTEGRVIEEIRYADNGDVVHHEVSVEGFSTEEVPVFVAG